MEIMYEAQVNSPPTYLAESIDSIQTTISLVDTSILPSFPTLLVIGFNKGSPETVKALSKNGNIITVERGFEGTAKSWDVGIPIVRGLTAYDLNVIKRNIEFLELNSQLKFITTHKFLDSSYTYFVGDTANGWTVNRYDINNNKTISNGTNDKPVTLLECQALSYS